MRHVDPSADRATRLARLHLLGYGDNTVGLLSRMRGTQLHHDVATALACSLLGLKDLNNARKNYVEGTIGTQEPTNLDHLVTVGEHCMTMVNDAIARVETRDDVPGGVVSSEIALRLCVRALAGAELLYSVGLRHEGDVVLRMMLEQAAWSFVARDSSDEEMRRLKPSRCVRDFKRLYPPAGRIYGRLTRSAHQTMQAHADMIEIVPVDGGEAVALTARHGGVAHAVARLAWLTDTWLVAWERTQYDYLSETLSVHKGKEGFEVLKTRPIGELLSSWVEEALRLDELARSAGDLWSGDF